MARTSAKRLSGGLAFFCWGKKAVWVGGWGDWVYMLHVV